MFNKYVGGTASKIPLETLLNYRKNSDLHKANELIIKHVPDEGKMKKEEDIAEKRELKATV